MSRDGNAGRGHSVMTDNSSIERVEEFKYLGKMLTDQNSIQEKIKSRLKLENASYHSVQNLLSSRLLSKNLKIKIYRTIILSVVLYGCETWWLALREERRLRVSENRVLPALLLQCFFLCFKFFYCRNINSYTTNLLIPLAR
jgi:hypothetical protein